MKNQRVSHHDLLKIDSKLKALISCLGTDVAAIQENLAYQELCQQFSGWDECIKCTLNLLCQEKAAASPKNELQPPQSNVRMFNKSNAKQSGSSDDANKENSHHMFN